MLESCELCPRRCKVNRLKGQRGFCGSGAIALVQGHMSHTGEEPPLSGTKGSGTIFFARCTMRCVYCQNYEFSQPDKAGLAGQLSSGREVAANELASMMLNMQKQDCHNINLVTPAHFIPQILEALVLASENGLSIPIVYNSSGYESVNALKLLDGIIDIYLPDMRYSDSEAADKYSDAADYPAVNTEAIKEMFRQVGGLILDEDGIAKKGLIVRHLILPNGHSGTEGIFKFISSELLNDVYISLMSQYYPSHMAYKYPEINRRITAREYTDACELLLKYGLTNGWVQDSPDKMDSTLLGTNIKKTMK